MLPKFSANWDVFMVSECANPECSAVFLYLGVGKLFPVEMQPAELRQSGFQCETGIKKPMRRVEFFWLCDTCATRMTLIFDKNLGVRAQTVARAQAAAL
ncbi:MAG: hypothetical protein JWO91_151 [Acidobacteriaceae bacterium]|nr:hypothetical protein [Acidobacteriaceae bacterium]